ncbi:MAG: hypothetical protein MI745_05155 [Pseudomonadales bacterium]|nr:hypothetical protein [Pseudomonadales bacterium]
MSDSSSSPAGLRARLQQLLLQLPPVQRVDERFHQVENEVLHNLKQRLDALSHPGELEGEPDSLHQLLDVSMAQNPDQARLMLVHQLLAGMTADEARIFAALSDGSAFPLLTVYSGGRFSRGEVLHRHSNVGRAAGVQCNEVIAFYLARLFARGLVIATAFTESLRTDYELLEGDSDYRKAQAALKNPVPKLKTRRETLRISPVGTQLWALMSDEAAIEE